MGGKALTGAFPIAKYKSVAYRRPPVARAAEGAVSARHCRLSIPASYAPGAIGRRVRRTPRSYTANSHRGGSRVWPSSVATSLKAMPCGVLNPPKGAKKSGRLRPMRAAAEFTPCESARNSPRRGQTCQPRAERSAALGAGSPRNSALKGRNKARCEHVCCAALTGHKCCGHADPGRRCAAGAASLCPGLSCGCPFGATIQPERAYGYPNFWSHPARPSAVRGIPVVVSQSRSGSPNWRALEPAAPYPRF